MEGGGEAYCLCNLCCGQVLLVSEVEHDPVPGAEGFNCLGQALASISAGGGVVRLFGPIVRYCLEANLLATAVRQPPADRTCHHLITFLGRAVPTIVKSMMV